MSLLAKATITLGFLLILLGIVGIFDSGFLFTNSAIENGIGPLRVLHQETKTVPVFPLVSGIVLLGGVALVASGAKQR